MQTKLETGPDTGASRYLLVYFPEIEVDGQWVYPHHPSQVEEMTLITFDVTHPEEQPKIVDKRTVLFAVSNGGVNAIAQSISYHLTLSGVSEVRSIFTVHSKSLLLRALRWGLLSENCSSNMSPTYNKLAGKTQDLCESFHQPAILPCYERHAFCTSLVRDVFGFELTVTPQETLLALSRRCM